MNKNFSTELKKNYKKNMYEDEEIPQAVPDEHEDHEDYSISDTKTELQTNQIFKSIKTIDNFYDLLIKQHNRKFFSMIVYGQRNSGKSFVVRDFIYQTKDIYDDIYLFSPTASKQIYYWNFVPKKNIINKFSQERIKEIFDEQENYIDEKMDYYYKKHKNATEDQIKKYKESLKHIVIIFDDFIDNASVRNAQENYLDKLFIQGRHVNISVIVLVQELMAKAGISKMDRNNTDLVFMFGGKSENNTKAITENFLSAESKKIGMSLYRKIINEQKYQCTVCLNFLYSGNMSDYTFKYISKPVSKKFKIGAKKEIDYHYNDDIKIIDNNFSFNINERVRGQGLFSDEQDSRFNISLTSDFING